MGKYILSIDQGTTSSRAILFDADLTPCAVAQKEFTQIFPQNGWVEHDPMEIWAGVKSVIKSALRKQKIKASDVAAIGITNQRETVVVWDRATGKPICNAIVWQDRRTAPACAALKKAGHEKLFRRKTGLVLDPYFSGTKIGWILDNVKGARKRAERGELCFGTIDSWLIWQLTGGQSHVTDATNASRTLMYNIRTGKWDAQLLDLLGVPKSMLPEVKDCAADFGTCDAKTFGAAIPITGVAGDQHAATIGQACFKPGMVKSTYGTGCFAMMNIGDKPITSKNNMLTTICYQLDGKPTYALEGSIFIAGAAVQWLRDGIGLIKQASQTGKMAALADETQDVYLVPAFVGLGAPYWDPDARGALLGLTRNSGPNEIAKATLESVGYQTRDLMEAMQRDVKSAGTKTVLRVDGGMAASDWTMQFLSNILQVPIDRPTVLETSAKGAAYLAGLHIGLYPKPNQVAKGWQLEKKFKPTKKAIWATKKYAGWQDAVSRVLSREI